MILTKIDWGSIPDWLSAIGTIGSTVVALYLANVNNKKLEIYYRDGIISAFDPVGEITFVNPTDKEVSINAIGITNHYNHFDLTQKGKKTLLLSDGYFSDNITIPFKILPHKYVTIEISKEDLKKVVLDNVYKNLKGKIILFCKDNMNRRYKIEYIKNMKFNISENIK